jgi:hypothetical protein
MTVDFKNYFEQVFCKLDMKSIPPPSAPGMGQEVAAQDNKQIKQLKDKLGKLDKSMKQMQNQVI